jgi:sulfur-oxidizing protein SoxY
MGTTTEMPTISRRGLLAGLAASLVLVALPAQATDAMVAEAIAEQFGDRPRTQGDITLELPPLAETGNNVPMKVVVNSALNGPQRPKRVVLLANLNPRAIIAEMEWGPGAARAEFSTNIRLSGTQDVIAIAELADGTLWEKQVRVLVTVGACDTLSIRY